MPPFDDRQIYVGLNKSGKTYCADMLTKKFKRIVWDPNFKDPRSHKFDLSSGNTRIWDVETTGPDEFEEFCKLVMMNRNCQVIVDEAPNAIPVYYRINPKKYPSTAEVLTRCRHKGHAIHIITLRPTSIPPTIWDLSYGYKIFSTHGEPSTKRLNATVAGLGDAAINDIGCAKECIREDIYRGIIEKHAPGCKKYWYLDCDGQSYHVEKPV